MYERKICRACLGDGLTDFFSAGEMPLANAFLRSEQLDKPEPRYPLTLCQCERCGMVQLRHVVESELMFKEDYPFFTGSSAVMSRHFIALMNEHAHDLPPNALVVEIGSNDGTALAGIERPDVRRLGVDPAENMPVFAAMRKGMRNITACFTESLVKEHILPLYGKAGLIVAANVLGHIDDIDDVMRGVAALLAPDGTFVIEVPYAPITFSEGQIGQIYHEHASFFSRWPLYHLLKRHGMSIENAQAFAVHGGSIRITARHGPARITGNDDSLAINRVGFSRRAAASRDALRDQLTALKVQGKRVIGYCASAKATVILNYSLIGQYLLPFVVDSTPAKQNKFVPGTHQPILPDTNLEEMKPDAILLLAPNHKAEIQAKETWFKGEWIVP